MNDSVKQYNIGLDAKRLFRNFTGLGNYSRTLAGNLRELFPKNSYLLFAEKTSENAEAVDFLSDRYEVVRPNSGLKMLWRPWRICNDIKEKNIDVYHGLSLDLPVGIRRTGAKSVVTIHDVCYKTFPRMFSITERWIYAIKYRHSLRVADRVVAISNSTKNDILHYFAGKVKGLADKTEVVYQALNPVFYTPKPHDKARAIVDRYKLPKDYLLYVGSINSRKNLMGIIEAYALLEPGKRMSLVVIGSGGGIYAKRCLARAEQLGFLEYVVVIEGVSSMTTLQAFYQCAKALIYPSFYEGFGLPVAEALLSGIPVITSLISSLPEAGGQSALYVDPYDKQQIADAICQVTALDDQQRSQRTAQGRQWALQTFDTERLTGQIEQIYKNLLR